MNRSSIFTERLNSCADNLPGTGRIYIEDQRSLPHLIRFNGIICNFATCVKIN
jgi:hypothetical protein